MKKSLPLPRSLPLTIIALSALLLCKSVTLVYAAGSALLASADTPQSLPATTNSDVAPIKPTGTASLLAPSGAPAKSTAAKDTAELNTELDRQRKSAVGRDLDTTAQANLLAAAQSRLSAEIEELKTQREALDRAQSTANDRDNDNWVDLAKMYEDMSPKNAAEIFNVIEVHVLLHILEHMNVRKASAVLANMDPQRARLATQMLALRRSGGQTADGGRSQSPAASSDALAGN